MIKKKDLPYDNSHKGIPLERAIGEWVTCEDGITRKVETIIHCAGSFQLCIINENVDAGISGHAVHLLKLFCQLRDQKPPTEEEIKKFDDIAKSWTYEYQGGGKENKRPVFKTKKGWH